ncbi:MAG: hypothetical protein RI973_373 [Bacteroidota bacterium]|jgi:hypothetical protein
MKTNFNNGFPPKKSISTVLQGSKLHALSVLLLFIICLSPPGLMAQEPSAILEVQSTEQGFLLPRMTKAQRDAIANPATGLMIYNTATGCLEINHGSTTSPDWQSLGCRGTIGSLNCAGMVMSGFLAPGQPTPGIFATIPYTGGNGSSHNGQTVSSTGVTGVTATLAAGSFANGDGTLTYLLTGAPVSPGTVSLALSIGGQSCTLNIAVDCGAYVSLNIWKKFMCHNLAAANTAADPSQPSWEIIGGYWQWGRKGPDPSVWLNTNDANYVHGPTGPGAGEANDGSVSPWSTTLASSTAWTDQSKTANDPCPAGYRIPTSTQMEGVRSNNPQSSVGSWTSGPINYSSGRFFGPGLFLPASGYRLSSNGSVFDRGKIGYYWTSTSVSSDVAWMLAVNETSSSSATPLRRFAGTLRCISE